MGRERVKMIAGVIIRPLKQISDERGKVMHMLRNDSDLFSGFGEVYFSTIYCHKIKAWKKHAKMTQNFAVPVGEIRLVIYDGRKESPTYQELQEIELGEDHYSLVKIPPLVWYGFQGVSLVPALIVNCSDLPHDPQESQSLEATSKVIPYEWSK